MKEKITKLFQQFLEEERGNRLSSFALKSLLGEVLLIIDTSSKEKEDN